MLLVPGGASPDVSVCSSCQAIWFKHDGLERLPPPRPPAAKPPRLPSGRSRDVGADIGDLASVVEGLWLLFDALT